MTPTPFQEITDAFVGAAHGDFDTVRNLLAEYPMLVEARATWGESALEAAAQTGRGDIAEHLLTAGAGLDICTAAMLGRKEQVVAFLEKDPDLVQAQGAHGIPLLYFPIIMENLALAEYLLQRGAPINAGAGAMTALHGAVAFDRRKALPWLLEHGARLDLQDYNGQTPLEAARQSSSPEIVTLLASRHSLNTT